MNTWVSAAIAQTATRSGSVVSDDLATSNNVLVWIAGVVGLLISLALIAKFGVRAIWTLVVVLVLVALLGCSSAPQRPADERYTRLEWAKGGADQAEAECHREINTLSGLGQSMYLCMRAKGWQEN